MTKESLDELIGIDALERLRRLEKRHLDNLFHKVILGRPKDDLIRTLLRDTNFEEILKVASPDLRKALLFEPKSEIEMKTAVGVWLKNNGWDSTKEEVIVVKESRADVVGFKRGGILGENLICTVELKAARASNSDLDRGFRQINDFLSGADYVYLAVTPLLLWEKGLNYFQDRLARLKAGLIVADGHDVLAILMEAKKSKPNEKIWKQVWSLMPQ